MAINGLNIDNVDSVDFNIQTSLVSDVWDMAAVDLDNDNNLDLIFSSFYPFPDYKISIAYGTSSFYFYPTNVFYPDGGPFNIALAFIDNDSLMDIVIASETKFHIFRNNGNRTFNITSYSKTSAFSLNDIAAGYFNNDPYVDFAMSDHKLYYGNGTGGYNIYNLAVDFQSVDVSDFNNDNYDDLIIGATDYTARIFLSNGAYGFTQSAMISIGATSYSVTTSNALADFDNDGNPDFAMVSPHIGPYHESKVYIGFGDGAGGIDHVDTIRIYGVAYAMTTADFNRDYNLDLLVDNSTVPRAEIYYGDGNGNFIDTNLINLPTANGTIAIASGDFDRDANPDFAVAGSRPNADILLALNQLPPEPDLVPTKYEMVTTGYSSVNVKVINPDFFEISRNLSTVAGSAFWRYDLDNNNRLDESSVDYNMQYGEYAIILKKKKNQADNQYDLGIRINGTYNLLFFDDYDMSWNRDADSLIFYYTVEEQSSIRPCNGCMNGDRRPTFDWSKLVVGQPPADYYQFQLDRYYDFQSPRFDVNDLVSPSFKPPEKLGVDSIFYWHFRAFRGGVWSDYSRTFATHIVPYICGDANGDGQANVSDAVYIINYVFAGGDPPMPVESGDANCDGLANVSDAVYIINYVFSGGYAPGDPNGDGIPDC